VLLISKNSDYVFKLLYIYDRVSSIFLLEDIDSRVLERTVFALHNRLVIENDSKNDTTNMQIIRYRYVGNMAICSQ
jgi:hypothetical protein